MSERYSRLFSLSENLYAVGSPVVIAAGTLLKDNQTGKIVAQLKMRSISLKTIIGAKVRLCLFDNAGKAIGDPVDFDYLDLNAARDAEFGQKTPVPVPESKARSYQAAIQEVVFADKTTWTASDAEWEPLPAQKTLDAVLVNAELIKQYKIAVGSNFSYYPLEEKGLWYCACGALNHEGESCHICHRTLFELQTIDLEQLAKDKDTRLVQEAAAAEAKAVAERDAAEAAKKKTAKTLKIVIPIVCAVIALIVLLNTVVIPTIHEKATLKKLEEQYAAAVVLMDAGEYEKAVAAFEATDGYKDSEDQIVNCENAIVDAELAKAEELLAAGDYDSAMAIYESLANIGGMEQAENAKLEAAYRAAEALAANGSYKDAYEAFLSLNGYKNSREQALSLLVNQIDTLEVGETVLFGTYEQDNNPANSEEPVEWQVLDKKDGKLLLLSRYALECVQYNTTEESITWEKSTLRKWLNDDFFNDAFTESEQSLIMLSNVGADANPFEDIDPGNNTKDYVFCLSKQEIEEYLPTQEDRKCAPTEYAKENGTKAYSGGWCYWWTRTPGTRDYRAVTVAGGGESWKAGDIYFLGSSVSIKINAVRPALWIDLNN